MAKINLEDISSGYAAPTRHNANYTKLEEHLNNRVLYRDNVAGEANHMENDLDMDFHNIHNVGSINIADLSIDGTPVVPADLATSSLPDQTGEDNKYLQTVGGAAQWVSIHFDNKAAAVAEAPVNGRIYFVGGTDGGFFEGVTGAAAATYADDGGSYCGTQFIPTGGDGSACYRRINYIHVTPEMFGAVTGTTTDISASLQLAVDSDALVIDGGGHEYKLNDTVDITVAKKRLQNMRLNIGTGVTVRAINVGADDVIIDGVSFIGGAGVDGVGVYVDSATGGAGSKIINCYFSDLSVGGAIKVRNWPADNGVLISGNTIDNCADTASGAQYAAINCNASYCTITDNIITNAEQTGISLFGADFCRISGNYIEGKSGSAASGGIILDGICVGNIIRGNTIKDVAVEGIQVFGNLTSYGTATSDNIVSENILENCEYSAISIHGANAGSVLRTVVSNNSIRSSLATNRALEFVYADKTNVTGNYVYGYAIGVNIAQSQFDMNLTGNTFENQDTTAIQCSTKKAVIANNRIIGDGAAGSTTGLTFNGSTIGGNQLVIGNQFSSCLVGITGTFSGSERTYIQSNFFLDCGTDMSLTSRTTNSTANNVTDDALSGEFTLVAGAATINNVALLADHKIVISKKTAGGTAGAVYVNSRTNGSGFTVASTNGADTSTWFYEFER